MTNIQEEFISTVSHELRTPLTSIRGFSQTLLNSWDKIDDESKKKFIGIIEEQSNRLINLVENILVVSKINTDKPARESALNASEQAVNDFNSQAGQYKSDNKGYNKIKAKINELKLDAVGTANGSDWVSHAGQVLLDKYINENSDVYLRGDVPFDDILIDSVYTISKNFLNEDYIDSNKGRYKTDVEQEVDNQATVT